MKLLGKEDSRDHSAAESIPTPTPRLNSAGGGELELGFQGRRIMSHLVLEYNRVTFSFRDGPRLDYIPSKSAEGSAQRPFQRKKALRMQHQDLDLSRSHLPVSLLGYASQLQGAGFG